MVNPTLKEVKKHFKNARVIKSLHSEITFLRIKDIYFIFDEPHCTDENGFARQLWIKEKGYAEILSYKMIKGNWYKNEERSVFKWNGRYDEKNLHLGYGVNFRGDWFGEDEFGWTNKGVTPVTDKKEIKALNREAEILGYNKQQEEKLYTEKDLVEFGNYILKYAESRIELQAVNDCQIQNFKDSKLN